MVGKTGTFTALRGTLWDLGDPHDVACTVVGMAGQSTIRDYGTGRMY